MLVIHGKTVFSPFRSAQLLGKVQAIAPDVRALEVSYVYWLKGDITPPKEAVLKTIFLDTPF